MFAELPVGEEQEDVEQGDQDHDDAGDAVDNAADGEEAFHGEQGAGPDLIGVFEGEAGPDEDEEGDGEQSVLEPFPRVHAELPGNEGGLGLGRTGLETEGAEFSDPIPGVVQQHEADGDGNDEQVEEAREAGLPGFGAAFGDVDGTDGEAGTGTGVAVATGLRQILRVHRRLGIAGGQDFVEAVAGGAVGDGLGAGFGGEAVEGVAESGDAVRGETEAAGEAEVAVAAAAGLADGGGADGRASGFGTEDGVFAVAVSADGGFGDAGGEGPAVDAGLVVGEDLGVAESAEFGDILVELGGFGEFGFVGLIVADGAIGRGSVAGADLFAVDGAAVVADLSGVAGVALRFREFFGVGVVGVFGMALGAGHFGVRRGGENLCLILVAGEAIDGRGLLRRAQEASEQESSEEAEPDDSVAARGCPFPAERLPAVTPAGGI